MSVQIPLAAVPSQTLGIVLGGQNCALAVFQRNDTIFLSLVSGGTTVLTTKACRTDVRLLLSTPYLGFVGDLVFVDTQNRGEQPTFEGLGTRWVLLYLSPTDVA